MVADVRYWHLADILAVRWNDRFWGQSGLDLDIVECPFMTQSGHPRCRKRSVLPLIFG